VDWSVYWFMLPACIVIASVAMFSGISGAALLTPLFLIGFPLLDAPRLTTVAAIGTALMLETSGFGMGVYRYLHFQLVDLRTAGFLITATLPLGALGAMVAPRVPAQGLRLGYGMAMMALAILLALELRHRVPATAELPPDPSSAITLCPGDLRQITTRGGARYEYCPRGLAGQRWLSGTGAFLAGLISTGVGEATMPPLARRSGFPIPVAAATSTVVVAGTVVGAASTHAVQLTLEGGFAAVPWNLIVWAVPGALIGAAIGTRLQGRVDEHAGKLFFAWLFFGIGLTFLVAFTVLADHFG
jgi:uncharacterized membrane protein YfcA